MNSDFSSLEDELRQLRCEALDHDLLARLEAAVDGSLIQLEQEDLQFEAQLRAISPAAVSREWMDQWEAAIQAIPDAPEDKIVPFSAPPKPGRSTPWWASAAAVAIIGAASALLLPDGKQTAPIAQQVTPPVQSVNPVSYGNLIPAAFDRGVSEVQDGGVVWKSRTQPRNVVRVVYQDKVTLRDESGRTIQVEQPRVQYLLVPARTD